MARLKKVNLKRDVPSTAGANAITVKHFSPYKFSFIRDLKGQIKITSPAIPWDDLTDEERDMQWGKCTNFIWNEEKDGRINRENLEPYFITYLKRNGYTKDDATNLRKLKEHQLSVNLYGIAFLLISGAKNPSSEKYFKSKIAQLIGTGKKILIEKKEENSNKKSVQDFMKEKLSDIMGDLESFADEQKPDMLKWFQTINMPKAFVPAIEDYYKPVLEELELAMSGKDAQVNEGYSRYKKKDIKKKLEWYRNLMTDLAAYKLVKQAQRKVRVTKPKPPIKLVSKLKFMPYDENTKLSSIKPETIVGASALWLYDTKNRKLCVYNASDLDKELTVKGTTILGWDPKSSVSKTLRKPTEQLTKFMDCGKVAMRNFLKDIRGKEATLNGRINSHMILLKVYK